MCDSGQVNVKPGYVPHTQPRPEHIQFLLTVLSQACNIHVVNIPTQASIQKTTVPAIDGLKTSYAVMHFINSVIMKATILHLGGVLLGC